MELITVAAVAENGVIGRDGEIPWPKIPADIRQYRDRVANDPVILGRRTFESMLDDLPGTAQIVLSHTEREYDVESVFLASDVEEAIDVATALGADRAYVIGGGNVYALFQSHVDRMFLSRVPGEYEGDVYFPEWDESEWRLVAETDYEGFTLEEWIRLDRTDL